MGLDADRVEELMDTLNAATVATSRDGARIGRLRLGTVEKWCLAILVGSIVLMVALAVWKHYATSVPTWFDGLLLATVLIYLLDAVAYVVAIAGVAVVLLWRGRREPYAAMYAASKRERSQDAELLDTLTHYDTAELAYARLQYGYCWESLNGRIAVIAGDIRKLGLFPAFAALSASVVALWHAGGTLWLWMPVVLAALFYLVAVAVVDRIDRSRHIMRLLDYAIEHHMLGCRRPVGVAPREERG